MSQCKHQVIDKEKSTYLNKAYRNCKLEAKEDGYCDLHNPKNIAEREESELIYGMEAEERKIRESECNIVGRYMLLKQPETFKRIISQIREAEELQKLKGFSGY